jgi:hypothetical protein
MMSVWKDRSRCRAYGSLSMKAALVWREDERERERSRKGSERERSATHLPSVVSPFVRGNSPPAFPLFFTTCNILAFVFPQFSFVKFQTRDEWEG